MAKTLIPKLTTLLSLTLLLLLSLHFPRLVLTLDDNDDDDNNDLDYVVDLDPRSLTHTRSRFLTTVAKQTTMREGASCDAKTNPNVCNGVSVNKGEGLLYCCKKHCRNVLRDKNNCGRCGHKCGLWEQCCAGKCTNVWGDSGNCGKCDKKCKRGVKCEYGYCGYA